MRPYEVMVILDATLEESAIQAVINRSTELVESRGGTVNRVDKWGRRRLAYEIAHRADGYYTLLEVTADPDPMGELDRVLHLADDVVRHKIVRVPDNAGGRVLPPGAADALSAEIRHSRDESRGRRDA